MALPEPRRPMLAKAVAAVPEPDSAPGGLVYEPKWDGFRCIVRRDGDEVRLDSRSGRDLGRYFPEMVEAARAHLPVRCAIDGELVVRSGERGSAHLDWDALTARIHPAASRVAMLSERTPAEFVAFDLLTIGDDDVDGEPFAARRARLEEAVAPALGSGTFHLTRQTRDVAQARDWFARFEGAGLDGVVAKPLERPYEPGVRSMLKVKHRRTAEAVVVGYRVHKSGRGVGSLLLGLYDGDELRGVGGIAAFTAARRLELIEELADLVLRDEHGDVVAAESARSRFSAAKDTSFVPLRPEFVVEVAFDQLEGDRFRHAVTWVRARPDRDPRSCTFDQIDRVPAYDLDDVFADR